MAPGLVLPFSFLYLILNFQKTNYTKIEFGRPCYGGKVQEEN